MLSDTERKTLRILYNVFSRIRRMPSLEELELKTGRSVAGIRQALAGLARERYIEWSPDRPERIVLLEGWERRE